MTVVVVLKDVDATSVGGHETNNRNIATSIDANGNLQGTFKRNFIGYTKYLTTSITTAITAARKSPLTKIILQSFSIRQSTYLDILNAKDHETYVSPTIFHTFQRQLEKHLKKQGIKTPLELNETLLADIYSSRKPGDTFKRIKDLWQKSLQGKDVLLPAEDEKLIKDPTKTILLYFIAHTHAAKYPKEPVELHIYDDDFEVLTTLQEFYTDNADILPKNVTIKLYQCRYQDQKVDEKIAIDRRDKTRQMELKPIQGTGRIDSNPAAGIAEMALSAYSDLEDKSVIYKDVQKYMVAAYKQFPDRLLEFKRARNKRLDSSSPFIHLEKHPLQAVLTGIGIGLSSYYFFTAAEVAQYVPKIAALLITPVLEVAAILFNGRAAAWTDKIRATPTRLFITTTLAVIAATACGLGLSNVASYVYIPTITTLSYLLWMPTCSALVNAGWDYVWNKCANTAADDNKVRPLDDIKVIASEPSAESFVAAPPATLPGVAHSAADVQDPSVQTAILHSLSSAGRESNISDPDDGKKMESVESVSWVAERSRTEPDSVSAATGGFATFANNSRNAIPLGEQNLPLATTAAAVMIHPFEIAAATAALPPSEHTLTIR